MSDEEVEAYAAQFTAELPADDPLSAEVRQGLYVDVLRAAEPHR